MLINCKYTIMKVYFRLIFLRYSQNLILNKKDKNKQRLNESHKKERQNSYKVYK